MVAIPSLGKIVILAIIGVAAFLFFSRSQQVGPGRAAGEIGEGLGSIGGGVQSFLTGIGTGTAQLLNPAFSLVELARQGGSLFGFNSSEPAGTRQTEQRPRELINAAGSGGPRGAIEANIEAGRGTRSAYERSLQQSFRQLQEAGTLNQYRGYFREVQEYLTPGQRRLL